MTTLVRRRSSSVMALPGSDNPYFKNLPFALNKGEAVLVKINDLSAGHIYQKKVSNLVPWKDNVFWLGSSYLWEFENDRLLLVFIVLRKTG